MPTQLKSETARINGAKSHGPATPEGKARSSKNSLKHGLTAKQTLLPTEDPAEYRQHLASYHQRFQPADGVERDLVDRLAVASWRIRRLPMIEAQLIHNELLERNDQIEQYHPLLDPHQRTALVFQLMSNNQHVLNMLSRHEGQLSRTFERTLKQLQILQHLRKNEPTAAPAPAPPVRPAPPLREAAPPSPIIEVPSKETPHDRLLPRKPVVGEPLQRPPRGPRHLPAPPPSQHS